MAYKIKFNGKREASYEWTDDEKQSTKWKKCKIILDEIVIKATGRNIHSKPFKRNIIYIIYDYGIFLTEKNIPIEVIVEFNHSGDITDIILPYKTATKATRRTRVREIVDAIVLADKQYQRKGGVLYTRRLHENPEMIQKLEAVLTELKK